ncbi:MAG: hypothetical protein R2710_02745 [Acidimicrobiales bacterium]
MKYLSESWLEAATHALSDIPPTDLTIRVGYDIVGGPDGVGPYTLVLGPCSIAFVPGLCDTSATLRLDYELAVDIAQGATSAQRAFLDGGIVLGGDVTALLGSAAPLTLIDDRLAGLRSMTDFAVAPDASAPTL